MHAFTASTRPGRRLATLLAFAALAALPGCGGGGGGDASAPPPPPPAPPPPVESGLTDGTPYSAAAGASLATPTEAKAITRHQMTLGGQMLAYSATAGHLTAPRLGTGEPQASFFYVAYTLDGAAAATRPVTFFYNGGPGSASMWLHLGSYGPRRLAANMPNTQLLTRFQLVDNAETLLDQSDLVFVDAVGTGWSQAIAPNTNRTFWGVDADAQVFRDFIARYLEVNGRQASPRVIFGESYGTLRSAVLAEELAASGVGIDGVVLLSSILDYNSNCAVFSYGQVSCAGYLPSYAATAAWFNRASPQPADVDAFVLQAMSFADQRYAPAVAAFIAGTGQPALTSDLAGLSGVPAAIWQSQYDLQPDQYRVQLMPGQLLGRYDARIAGSAGGPLARDGDPSITVIEAPFVNGLNDYLPQELNYRASAAYTSLSDAVNVWQWRHDNKALPDSVPDLAAAMTLNPRLRVLSLNGRHDLATPFHQTGRDIARFGNRTTITLHHVAGGHMTYLDDAGRRAQRAALQTFYQSLRTAP